MGHAPLDSETPNTHGGSLEPRVGDMLGAYRLETIAGEGGMGRVFRAVHTKLNKRVAVKVLRRRYASRPEAIQRFFQEARAVNVIRHPNIVEITDFVEGPSGGDSYYIMEWLEGSTLAQRLARDHMLPIPTVVTIGRQLASALAAVHQAGFVHRDLKPDNVFLIELDGRLVAKILDFGVAVLQGPTDGAVAGTPAYLSPECAAGRAIDGRSDVYSLGVMLYELLAGAPPFQAGSFSEYVMKHMTARPRSLHEASSVPVPQPLVDVIARCLEKAPEARFQTMAEMEDALAALGVDEDTAAPRYLRGWPIVAVGVGLALLAAAVVVLMATRRPATPPRAPAVSVRSTVAPAPARLDVAVSSEPLAAEVFEDDVLLGITPCAVHLPSGVHHLRLRHEGFQETPLDVEARAGGSVSAKLIAIPVEAPAAPRPAPLKPRPAPTKETINPFE
jgi:serine/threonine-protein kinase